MLSGWYAKLFDEQVGAADFIVRRLSAGLGAALLSDPGTGKTIVTLAAIERLKPKKLLIVAPLTSLDVTWGDRIRDTGGTVARSIEDRAQDVLLIGYEYFRNNIKRLLRMQFDMAVFDESQGLKTRSSLQSRSVRKLRMKIPMRLILSGTPIDESPMEFWAQLRFAEPSCLGDVWAAPRDRRKYKGPYFAEDFCTKGGFMNKEWRFIDERLPQFLERIAPCVYRLVDKLPPAEFITVPTRIWGRQRVLYEQMRDHGIIKFDGQKVKAAHSAIRDLRCFQIVGGYLSLPDGPVRIGAAKQRALRTLLKELDRPVVFCRFLSELEEVKSILQEKFRNVATLDGSVKDKKNNLQRTQLLKDFQSKKLDSLAVQARTGGVSIEFSSTRDIVFYSMGYSLIDFKQIIARCRRYGQEKRVRVFLIIARDTIDEEPLARVTAKGETVNPIMDYLKESSMAEAKKAAKKAAKKTPVAKKTAKKETPKFEFGVDYVAEKLDVSASAVRGKLRDGDFKKTGKSYGWATKAEADKVVKQLTPSE